MAHFSFYDDLKIHLFDADKNNYSLSGGQKWGEILLEFHSITWTIPLHIYCINMTQSIASVAASELTEYNL